MSIDPLNLGSAPDDGTGQDLRSGGQVINDNFAELDTRTAAAQAAANAAERTLVAGENILIDRTDPDHPVISASGGGAGTVQTVAGVNPDGGGDIPAAGLSSALGLDNKVDKVAGKGLSSSDFTAAEKTKLAGVATDATKNATDAALRDRATHTGTQLAATISDLAIAVRLITLAGLSLENAAITSTDSILVALGRAQGQINQKLGLSAKAADSALLNGQNAAFYTKAMVGATASVAGAAGLVPAPVAGDQLKFLCGDGSFKSVVASAVWGGVGGNLADQLDLKAALDLKLNTSAVGATIVYPNGGTEAAPALAQVNSRYLVANPYPGFFVACYAQIRISGNWGNPEFVGTGTGSSIGVRANLLGSNIVVQTGTGFVGTSSNQTGDPFGISAMNYAPSPVRVIVVKTGLAI